MNPFDLLFHEDAILAFRKIRGENRKALRQFFDLLPDNPYLRSDSNYEDKKGRIVSKMRIRQYVVDYQVDDPLKEIKVLEINRIVRTKRPS